MSGSPVLRLGARRVQTARVHLPSFGVWVADIVCDDVADASGTLVLTLGGLELHGTVDPTHTGAYALGQRVRLLGGAGAWSSTVTAKGYHNDAGVKAALVAADAARAVGETLDPTGYGARRVGPDFARSHGPASRVLEQLGAPWWVDALGVTRVGARPVVEVAAPYELLAFDPDERVATLGVDDAGAIGPGSILRDKLSAPMVVRDLEIDAGAKSLRLTAWCSALDEDPGQSRLVRALRSLVREAIPQLPYLVPRRYRIVDQIGERLELQAVRQDAGVPDLLLVPVVPGLAGARAVHTLGATCLVQFVDGDPAAPVVTHLEDADGNGFVPVGLTLDATDHVTIGEQASDVLLGDAHGVVIRDGDTVTLGAVTGVITTTGQGVPPRKSKVKA
jgi:hypothetical protein